MLSRHACSRLIRLSCSTGIPTCRCSDIAHTWSADLPLCNALGAVQTRAASSKASSSARWQARQANDQFAREAKVAGLKSRAAFKLLQINEKHRLFKAGQTVVDLGYAPGSWSQVAANRCSPGGRIIGVDILPAQPPRGVSTIQGNFLSPEIQAEVRAFVTDSSTARTKEQTFGSDDSEQGYIDLGRQGDAGDESSQGETEQTGDDAEVASNTDAEATDDSLKHQRVVDVVLSDMMMNTSGIAFRDHAGSMDLCLAALEFAYDTLKPGGHFVCKFYQGAEDRWLEKRIRRLFEKTHRDKPSASRSESKEGYFIGMRRKRAPSKAHIFAELP